MALNNLDWSLEYYEEHSNECNDILNSLSDFDQITVLNSLSLQKLKDGALVRYRGMIQDMLNPEYYFGDFIVLNKDNHESYIKSGKYRDVASCGANEEIKLKDTDSVPKERLVFFCVPLPGTNDWVHQFKTSEIKNEQPKEPTLNLKRPACDDSEMETDIAEASPSSIPKRTKPSTSNTTTSQDFMHDMNKYFPIPSENSLPCIIKMYEDEEKSGILLNDSVEVIGFLSLNPELEANSEDNDAEDKALNPPPSLVPRIHVLKIRKLRHSNPLLKQIISYDDFTQLAENARSDLHLVLSQLLFEDTLAADYVICNLISSIYVRNELNTLGKFSLNLFNITLKSFASGFYDVLKTLVTNSHYVSLSTNLLNEKSFTPRKDYETNRLWSGMLQLCDGVHLVLDETKMNEGQLNNTGCLNVAALQKIFRDQEIEYDFGYYPVKYNTNLPVIVISEGKSMFEADVRVKVRSEGFTEAHLNESLEAVRVYLKPEMLNKIRIYLTSIRLREFELGEKMVQKIGEDFVSLRQQDRNMNSSDLHLLLILARLLALSRGRTTLEPADWNQAVEMETERKLR